MTEPVSVTADARAEGVYCRWETYPALPEASVLKDNILVIERVNGNGTVISFCCARSEADLVRSFLNESRLQRTKTEAYKE